MSLNTLETIRYEKNGEILNGVSSPNPVSSKERVVKLWAEILPNEDKSAVLHYLIVDENGTERTEEISVTALEDLINALDSTKVDIEAFRIDLGLKHLEPGIGFSISPEQLASISTKFTSILEVTDDATGLHRYFARASYEPNNGIIYFTEAKTSGSVNFPNISQILINVGLSQCFYDERVLQPLLSDETFSNIASIPNKVDSPVDAGSIKQVGKVRENDGALEYELKSNPNIWKIVSNSNFRGVGNYKVVIGSITKLMSGEITLGTTEDGTSKIFSYDQILGFMTGTGTITPHDSQSITTLSSFTYDKYLFENSHLYNSITSIKKYNISSESSSTIDYDKIYIVNYSNKNNLLDIKIKDINGVELIVDSSNPLSIPCLIFIKEE